MLRTTALDYTLPAPMIATHPVQPRDSARLMVVSAHDANAPAAHATVRDLPDLLRAGDLLVVNSSRVLPARFRGVRADTGGIVDGLYLGPAPSAGPLPRWGVLLKARRAKPGVTVTLDNRSGSPSGISLRLLERHHDEDSESGGWVVELLGAGSTREALDHVGLTPLPPYIRQARKAAHDAGSDAEDQRVYQTVFAHDEAGEPHGAGGSVAAPTAGLHFTPELFDRLRAAGVETAEVTLHVGIGTFKPVDAEFVEQHPMHSEWCSIPESTGLAIDRARARGGRVIAVGTTTARTLETFADLPSLAQPGGMGTWTRILITPGHRWRWVDALLTNFHLPRSTLLAMVAARLGHDESAAQRLIAHYHEAIAAGYRFYSFGDAMLVR
ncbi:MAG: tRNA preQ1(34) S-adenosylmethionine ribosyltransferase-isomerase QueA [Phycisphaeraceae bacterium]|nr:tRNA preQ1(34) S-adenosylmethionine ribosyltransferase-isomerase QueA [Phycisphaeraceae bacterium]